LWNRHPALLLVEQASCPVTFGKNRHPALLLLAKTGRMPVPQKILMGL